MERITRKEHKPAVTTPSQKKVDVVKAEAARVQGKDKDKKAEAKSIEGRAVSGSASVPSAEETKIPELPPEMLAEIGRVADLSTFAAMHQVSKDVNEACKAYDLKMLEDFEKNSQLGFKDRILISFLKLVSQSDTSPSLNEVISKASIDMNLSQKELKEKLPEMESNYNEIKSLYDQLVSVIPTNIGAHSLGVPISAFIFVAFTIAFSKWTHPIPVETGYGVAADILNYMYDKFAPSVLPALGAVAGQNILSIVHLMQQAGRIATFRTAVTGIMQSFAQKLGY